MGLIAILLILTGLGVVTIMSVIARDQRRIVSNRVSMAARAPEGERRRGLGEGGRLAAEALAERFFNLGLGRQWGVHSRGRSLLTLATFSAAVVFLGGVVLVKVPGWIAVLLAVVAFLTIPRGVLILEQRRSAAQFTDLFPNAIDSIIRMLRAGLPITAAVRAVGTEGQPPISGVFEDIADEVGIGIPLPQVLSDYAERIDLPDFRFFSVAVSLQHATGGNLTLTLEILSEIIRKRRAVRMRAKAVTAEVRMTAYVLAAIPIVVVLGLLAFNPAYLDPLIHDPRGNVIAGLAAGSLILGLLTMRVMTSAATRI